MGGRAFGLLALLITTTALAASDWPTGKTAQFWALHPLVAGVVSGVVVLAIGYLWRAHETVGRREPAPGISFKELGDVADEISRGLEVLLGGARAPWEDRQALGSAGAWCIQRAEEYGAVLTHLSPEDHSGRLDVLLADGRWVAAAVDAIDNLKHAHRRHIALWTPVLRTTEEAPRILDDVNQLNERVSELQAPLRRLRDVPAIGAELDSDGNVRETKERWQRVLFETVLLQERLMCTAVPLISPGTHG